MSYARLMRWSGLAGLFGGAVTVLFNLGNLAGIVPTQTDNYRVIATILLTIFALIGFYAYQYTRAGVLGLLGFIMTATSLMFNIGIKFIFTFIAPILAAKFPDAASAVGSQAAYSTMIQVTYLLFVAGYVLFGIATLRAGVLPRVAAWLLIIGAVINYVATFVMLPAYFGGILTGLGIAWLGYALWARSVEPIAAVRPQPAT